MDRFSELFFCSIGNRTFRNIFNFVFEESEKSQNSWNKRPKNFDYERYDHFVTRDIEHRILNNFPDNLSLIRNLFINLCKAKKSWAAVARYLSVGAVPKTRRSFTRISCENVIPRTKFVTIDPVERPRNYGSNKTTSEVICGH